ncbi:MAG: alternative ribosome rescue aminoacyl-tRNA hydrolase ArfB [Bacteroidota bacterium]
MDLQPLLLNITYRTSRSSGSGGQNVNKVSTRVELLFDLGACAILSDSDKQKISLKLKNRINSDGILRIVSQKERTQLGNKKVVTAKFFNIIENCLKPVKRRRATQVPEAEKETRIREKKIKSVIKENRRKIE